MKIRYASLAVACAVAMSAAATAQAAPITYTFGGTLDSVSTALPSLAVGDTFTGSFSIESTAANLLSGDLYGFYAEGYSMTVTVNGHIYSSSNTASNCCGGVTVLNAPNWGPSGYYGFITSNYGLNLLDFPAVTGPSLDGSPPWLFEVSLENNSNSFDSVALPSNLTFSSFDGIKFFRLYFGPGGLYSVKGALTSFTQVTAAPVPEASTSAMLALGLGALAWARRRQRG